MSEKRLPAWLRLFSFGVYVYIYVPILILMVFSFNTMKLNVRWQGFTLALVQGAVQRSAGGTGHAEHADHRRHLDDGGDRWSARWRHWRCTATAFRATPRRKPSCTFRS